MKIPNKKILALSLSAALILTSAGRTWTNAEGDKSFDATFRDYNAETGVVTLIRNGTKITFEASKLSKADQEWLASNSQGEAGAANVGDLLSQQKIGKNLVGGVLHTIQNGKFKKYELAKAPDYYLLYFSASWCGPCVAAAPGMVKKYNDIIAPLSNVEMIHVSADQSEDAAEEWAKKENFPWPTVLPKQAKKADLGQFAERFVPAYRLVDKEGNIIANGVNEVFEKIKELGQKEA